MSSWDKDKFDDLTKHLFNKELGDQSKDIKKDFEKSYTDLCAKLIEIEKVVLYADKNKWENIKYIWNLAGFILLISLDLKILSENLIFQQGFMKKELFFKNICVLIYEASEDIEQLIGEKFFAVATNLDVKEQTIQELKQAKKLMSKFRKDHKDYLRNVRLIIGAHRDHNFISQIELITSFDVTSFILVFTEFDRILNNISVPLQCVINESAENFVKKQKPLSDSPSAP